MSYLSKIGVIIVILGIMLYMYGMFRDEHNKYQQYEYNIDSLNKEIIILDSIHFKKDSIITIYKDSIIYLDKIVDSKIIEIIKIKEKYNEIHSHIIKYNNYQLDSFFSNRYRY